MSDSKEYVCTHMPDNWGEKYRPHLGEPIVRCRDCVHGIKADLSGNWYECMKPDGNGDYARYEVESDGYCAWGERRDERKK